MGQDISTPNASVMESMFETYVNSDGVLDTLGYKSLCRKSLQKFGVTGGVGKPAIEESLTKFTRLASNRQNMNLEEFLEKGPDLFVFTKDVVDNGKRNSKRSSNGVTPGKGKSKKDGLPGRPSLLNEMDTGAGARSSKDRIDKPKVKRERMEFVNANVSKCDKCGRPDVTSDGRPKVVDEYLNGFNPTEDLPTSWVREFLDEECDVPWQGARRPRGPSLMDNLDIDEKHPMVVYSDVESEESVESISGKVRTQWDPTVSHQRYMYPSDKATPYSSKWRAENWELDKVASMLQFLKEDPPLPQDVHKTETEEERQERMAAIEAKYQYSRDLLEERRQHLIATLEGFKVFEEIRIPKTYEEELLTAKAYYDDVFRRYDWAHREHKMKQQQERLRLRHEAEKRPMDPEDAKLFLKTDHPP